MTRRCLRTHRPPTDADSQTSGISRGNARPSPLPHAHVISGMMSSATMFATLIIGLIAGPAVSL